MVLRGDWLKMTKPHLLVADHLCHIKVGFSKLKPIMMRKEMLRSGDWVKIGST